jgi:hypothetical protein
MDDFFIGKLFIGFHFYKWNFSGGYFIDLG